MVRPVLAFVGEEMEKLRREGLEVVIRTIESPQGRWVTVNGKNVLNLCSNNYLGFCNDPQLKEAAIEAIERYGVGPGAVRTIAGTMTLHLDLERKLAEFKGAEDVVSFQSGFCANLAVIPLLVGREDGIFSDELNHASIIDGCRLSRGEIIRYRHTDPDDLREKLKENRHRFRRALIITDGVFSMDGDIAPLPDLVACAQDYQAMVMVDDAHGEGVLGRGGRGITDHFGLHGQVDVEVGTLSKAFGVVGGYVASGSELAAYLRQRGRPFLFSSAVTLGDVAACLRAVEMLLHSEERVRKLWENTRYFQGQLKEMGLNTGKTQTPITPVILGEAPLAQEFSRLLFEEGVFAQAIGYPTVPRGSARIRMMLSAVHTKEDLDFALGATEKVARRLKVLP